MNRKERKNNDIDWFKISVRQNLIDLLKVTTKNLSCHENSSKLDQRFGNNF